MISSAKINCLRTLVFLIPFQQWQPFGSPYTNATFIVFFLYVALSIIEGRANFSLNEIFAYLWPIMVVLSLMFVMTIQNDFPGATNTYSEVRQLIMQMIFFILLANDLSRNLRLELELLFSFIAGVLLMTVFYLLGVGVATTGGRTTIFDINSNALAFWFSLSTLIIIRLNIEKLGRTKVRQAYLLCIPVFVYIITFTGSRGALIALFAGSFFYVILLPWRFNKKLPMVLAGTLMAVVGAIVLLQTDIVQQRIQQELTEQNFGGRKAIWDLSLLLIQKNTWWGVGASGFEKYLVDNLGKLWSPHNEYLLILAYTGVIGFIFFLIFIIGLFIVSLNLKPFISSSFYAMIILVFFIHFYTTGGFITSFTCWFFLALIVGMRKSLVSLNHTKVEV